MALQIRKIKKTTKLTMTVYSQRYEQPYRIFSVAAYF